MKIVCPDCRFDLARVPIQLRFSARDGEASRAVTCPICSGRALVQLMEFGIFPRSTANGKEYFSWKIPDGPRITAIGGGMRVEPRGAKGISFHFDVLRTEEPRHICHRQALAFEGEGGTLAAVHLPVREEYFDCIDFARVGDPAALASEGQSTLVWHLPLRGLARPQEVHVPLITQAAGGVAPVRGVNVRVWPRPLPDWQTYLVGMAAVSEEGEQELARGTLRVRARTDAGRWFGADAVQRGGHTAVGISDGVPTWVSIEWAPPGGTGPAAGGIFHVPTPKGPEPQGTLEMALDFGTSNTCVAYLDTTGSASKPSIIPALTEAIASHYIVRAGAESTRHAGPDLWPSASGVGPHKDLFPSEILLPRSRAQTISRPEGMAGWRYGVEFGIPGPHVTGASGYRERDHVISEFKWQSALSRQSPELAAAAGDLQAAYIEAVLLQSFTRIVLSGKPHPATIEVKYSFPLAFNKHEHETLTMAMHRASERLSRATGLRWSMTEGADESEAAAANVSADAHLAGYVDMGGGSTDIALVWQPKHPERGQLRELLFSTSVRYAGSGLLDGFAGDEADPRSSCLAPAGGDELRRRVREAPRVADLRVNPQVFKTSMNGTIVERTRHFYAYVVEYVARMIAASLLDGLMTIDDEYWPPQEANAERPCKVALFFLGNGWGFVEFVSAQPYVALTDMVQARVQQILENEPLAEQIHDRRGIRPLDVQLDYVDGRIDGLVPHRKAAVAYGLLTGRRNARNQSAGGVIGLVGWTAAVNDGAWQIEWFRRFGTTESTSWKGLFGKRSASDSGRPSMMPPSLASSPPPSAASPFAFPGQSPWVVGGKVRTSLQNASLEGMIDELGEGGAFVRFDAPRDGTGRLPRGAVPVGQLRMVASGSPSPFAFPGMEATSNPAAAAPFAFPGTVSTPPTLSAGTRVEMDVGPQRFAGVCFAMDGAQASVEWHTVRQWRAFSEMALTDATEASTPGTVSRGGSLAPPPGATTAQWTSTVPKPLQPNHVLSFQADVAPGLPAGLRHPFSADGLDPGLRTSLSRVQEACKRDAMRQWLEAGPYEAILEHVIRRNLHKVSAS